MTPTTRTPMGFQQARDLGRALFWLGVAFVCAFAFAAVAMLAWRTLHWWAVGFGALWTLTIAVMLKAFAQAKAADEECERLMRDELAAKRRANEAEWQRQMQQSRPAYQSPRSYDKESA